MNINNNNSISTPTKVALIGYSASALLSVLVTLAVRKDIKILKNTLQTMTKKQKRAFRKRMKTAKLSDDIAYKDIKNAWENSSRSTMNWGMRSFMHATGYTVSFGLALTSIIIHHYQARSMSDLSHKLSFTGQSWRRYCDDNIAPIARNCRVTLERLVKKNKDDNESEIDKDEQDILNYLESHNNSESSS